MEGVHRRWFTIAIATRRLQFIKHNAHDDSDENPGDERKTVHFFLLCVCWCGLPMAQKKILRSRFVFVSFIPSFDFLILL